MNLREQFENQSDKSAVCYSTMTGSFNDEYVEWLESRLSHPPAADEFTEVEKEDNSQEIYDTIKERIKNFLIHKVNTMKWFDIEYKGETFDGIMVDEIRKIIKSY